MGLFNKREKYPGAELLEASDVRELRCSIDQLVNFIDGVVWADMKDIINMHIGEAQNAMEIVQELDKLRELQGMIKAYRMVVDLPERMHTLKEVEDEEREEKAEKENGKP